MTAMNRNEQSQQQQQQQQQSSSSSPSSSPHSKWIIKNEGSFATIHVTLPPQTSVHCESDAVVSFSHGIEVRGVMSGGILSSLARYFLTKESFFTTIVENTNQNGGGGGPVATHNNKTADATVMMAPSNPGGIVLHTIEYDNSQHPTSSGTDTNLLLKSGSYIASDATIVLESTRQSKLSTSVLSGTGYCVLRATVVPPPPGSAASSSSSSGVLAFGAYGAVHKFVLAAGEIRAVDNGHVLAWSESMTYWTNLAVSDSSSSSSSGGRGSLGTRLYDSVTSGEGLMCFFEGPGVVYVQSHKVESNTTATTTSSGGNSSANSSNGRGGGTSVIGTIFGVLVMVLVIFIFAVLPILDPERFGFLSKIGDSNNNGGGNYYDRSSQQQRYKYNSRSHQTLGQQQQGYNSRREL